MCAPMAGGTPGFRGSSRQPPPPPRVPPLRGPRARALPAAARVPINHAALTAPICARAA